jgi:nucleotide-binding universal stress UspA family protein
MFKKVLIATDGSDHASKAVAVGADIAAKYDAAVVLVHVQLHSELSEHLRHMAEVEGLAEPSGPSLERALASVPEGHFPANLTFAAEDTASSYKVLNAIGKQVLHRAETEARDHGAKNIASRMADGDPVKRILEIAEEEKADLVVAGARGLSDVAALVVGSVSHKLSHLSPVTCITVR